MRDRIAKRMYELDNPLQDFELPAAPWEKTSQPNRDFYLMHADVVLGELGWDDAIAITMQEDGEVNLADGTKIGSDGRMFPPDDEGPTTWKLIRVGESE